jgi:hypothetical protein
MSKPTITDPAGLPEVVRRYQDAHDERNTDTAVAAFAADATVVDEDHEYRGADEIRFWLSTASQKFTYTRTFLQAEATEADRWVVVNRLVGNFPGREADLRYQFRLRGDRISELVISP